MLDHSQIESLSDGEPDMTININELRKVIADCYWPTSPVTINKLLDRLEEAEKERDTLRAKIEAMEQQEPVGEIQRANSTGNCVNSVVWVPMAVGSKLYAIPGAQGEKK